jgi:hypothetical protein
MPRDRCNDLRGPQSHLRPDVRIYWCTHLCDILQTNTPEQQQSCEPYGVLVLSVFSFLRFFVSVILYSFIYLFIHSIILMQCACGRTYVWRHWERSWVQRSGDGARLGEVLLRVCTDSWTIETSCTRVSTRRILRWSRHSWHKVNTTDRTSQVWNMKQFVLDITIALYWRGSIHSALTWRSPYTMTLPPQDLRWVSEMRIS